MSENVNNSEELRDDMMVDVVTFVDDEGNEFEMEIVDEFVHQGKAYAVLAELNVEEHDHECGDANCEGHQHDDEEASLFIFEVTKKGEEEEFTPIEDDSLLDELSVIVEGRLLKDENN